MFLRQDEVLLRSWQTDDAQWYVQARDEQVFKWTTEPRELTVQETELAIQQVNESDDLFSFAIADSESNELLGKRQNEATYCGGDVLACSSRPWAGCCNESSTTRSRVGLWHSQR
jgi:hypothetical protein